MARKRHAMGRTAEPENQFDIDAMLNQVGKAGTLLSAMCNEKRLMILCQLIQGERSVNELVELLSTPQSTISQHLALLRREGFVKARRHAQTQYYSLLGNEARAVLETLQSLYCDPRLKDA